MFISKIDGKEFPTEKKLHAYISKTLKVKLEEYYPKYYPRFDLHTNESIEYKNREFYLSSLFNNRKNLIAYLKSHPDDQNTIKEVIRLRAQAKSLTFAPSTIEARTSILPTPLMVDALGFDYNEICKEIGLIPRYDYNQVLTYETEKRLSVLIDTREQHPLKLDAETVFSKLDFGDYISASHYKKIFVERKSLPDLCGTLSKGFERFKKELERAKELDSYIVVCVEEPLKAIGSIGYAPHTKHIRATPEFICARIRALCQEYDNVQFLFLNGRIEMVNIIQKIFRMKNDIRAVDLQFQYDIKKLV